MRVAIDIRPALRRGTGVGMFVEQLVLALDGLRGDHSLRLFTSSSKDRWPADRLAGLKRCEVIDRRWPVRLLNLLWARFGRPRIEHFVGKVEIAHSPTPLLLPSRAKRVVTLHDLWFLRRPEHTRAEIRRDYAPLIRRHVSAADAVVAVSAATADEAVELIGAPRGRMVICREDASPLFDEKPTEHELAWADNIVPGPFILFVGTIEPRKNLETLLRAFGIVQSRYPELRLVIAGGRGWGCEPFDEALEKLSDPGKVIVTGYIEQTAIRALYHRAAAMAMVSHCEGFGLPVVEAMACGCPLVLAQRSALPEVAGKAALYCGGDDEGEIAEQLTKLLEDSDLRADLVRRGGERRKEFSWALTAEIVLALYRDLAG